MSEFAPLCQYLYQFQYQYAEGASNGGHPRNGNMRYNFLKRFGFNTIERCDCLEEKP